MSNSPFFDEIRTLFPDAVANEQGFVVLKYDIPVGGRVGETVELALQVPSDWPLSCPPGPHVSPAIGHPGGAVHASPLGIEWQYWSRPFPNWAGVRRTAATYMSHIRTLFSQFPEQT